MGKWARAIIAVLLILLALVLAALCGFGSCWRSAAQTRLGGGQNKENVKVLVLGKRPAADTPVVVFIGGLGTAADDQIAEWNFDETAGPAIRQKFPHVTPTWGVQPMVARYTKTLSFDWPGTGGSAAHSLDALPKTMEEEAIFVRKLAHVHGCDPPLVVVGMSMGAKTALMVRSLYPTEVVGTVLIDPAPFSYLNGENAIPGVDYETEHPVAARRIRAAVESRDRFGVDKLKTADDVIVHLNLVPNDAPEEVQTRNAASLCENEATFKRTVRHYGAGHAVMVTDPRPVIASILRFVAPICSL